MMVFIIVFLISLKLFPVKLKIFLKKKIILKQLKNILKLLFSTKKMKIFISKEVNVMQSYQCGLNLLKMLKKLLK
jgi:hypothetical protein